MEAVVVVVLADVVVVERDGCSSTVMVHVFGELLVVRLSSWRMRCRRLDMVKKINKKRKRKEKVGQGQFPKPTADSIGLCLVPCEWMNKQSNAY